jgi:nondiscriminating aspartyl-tRNA synthetase
MAIGQRILSSHLKKYLNQAVSISGWLHKKRNLGKISFLIIRDRAGLMQVVIDDPEQITKIDCLYQGSVLNITGTVIDAPKTQFGCELHNVSIDVVVPVTDPSPIEIDKPIDHRQELLAHIFDWRILTMRNITEQGIFKIQSGVSDAIRSFLASHEFVEFHSPKLLSGSTEGGAEVFKLDYFGKQATLAQSAQFYKQIMVGAFERVFEFGATYRAEPSITSRHLTEFITVDVEMGYITGILDIMQLINELIIHVSDFIWLTHERDLGVLGAKKPVLAQIFPIVPLQKLHKLCFEHTGQDFRGEKDPSPFEERWICSYMAEQCGSEAVFITGFPASDIKFYHYNSTETPELAERFDLLFRGVEIITGSQREHRYNKLIEQLIAMGGNPEDPGFKYYLQAFRYGMPPHGGFGLGLERLTQKLIGLGNVKEACIFPRDINRLAP